ncbi:MAG: SAM-dependent methyltransferase [Chthoniobacterales bacterium]
MISTIRQALQTALDQNDGAIPFDTFMGIALHHPQDGYYTRNIRGIGARGDFTTVPQKSPALGTAVAQWLCREAESRGWRNYHVIECGPGEGTLAASVMRNFGFFERRRISLHLVETSEPLRGRQQDQVRQATWHPTITEALAACGGRALIYHNEFFDAFPCRVFRQERDAWTELHLRAEGGTLKEVFLPPQRSLPNGEVFQLTWPEGQRVEVFESVHNWMRELSKAWSEGAMLVIDYGGTVNEIYHRRPQGTLRAYRGQQRLHGEAVYEMPGHQDITADVNFDDLQKWAAELRWKTKTTEVLNRLAPDAPGADAFRHAIFTKM